MSPAANSAGDSSLVVSSGVGVTRHHLIGWVAMVVGMFMAILDIQIVASSLPDIQAGLAASPDEIGWIQTSYLMAEVVMIPLSGYLARLLSTRILFMISAAGFTAMSVACAFAGSIESMILFRTLQGFLGGAMIPTVFATAFTVFPRERQTLATVIVGLVATMAPTIGPTLGGWLTENMSWHWLFLINLGPGLAIIAVVAMAPAFDRGDRSLLKGFDLAGLVLMALFLGSLQFILDEGPKDDWFDEPLIVQATLLCIAAGGLFLWRMFAYRTPIVDLRAFADRNFALGCAFSFIIGIGLYGTVYLAPLFLSQVRGYNALQIGVIMAVTGGFQFLSAPVAGRLARVLDLRLMLGLGLGLFGFGVYLTSLATHHWSFDDLFLPQAVRGFSLMFLFVPVNALALGTLAPDKIKNASGLYNLMRNLGGAIGLAAINTIYDARYDLHMARLSDRIDPTRPEFRAIFEGLSDRLGDMLTGAADAAAMKVIVRMVEREATVLAFNDVYLVMALVFVAGFCLMPLLRKPQQVTAEAH